MKLVDHIVEIIHMYSSQKPFNLYICNLSKKEVVAQVQQAKGLFLCQKLSCYHSLNLHSFHLHSELEVTRCELNQTHSLIHYQFTIYGYLHACHCYCPHFMNCLTWIDLDVNPFQSQSKNMRFIVHAHWMQIQREVFLLGLLAYSFCFAKS